MFGRRITLFKLFGFAVRADASWLLIVALVTSTLAAGYFPFYYPGLPVSHYWWMALAGALLLFLSIVIHELFHSLVARRYGLPMKGITLFVFGGIAEMDDDPPEARTEFLMAIAGPIASLLIGAGFYLLWVNIRDVWPVQIAGVIRYLWWVNLILAAFNMVPAFPLDGGRVLRSVLWWRSGDLRSATYTASRLGNAFANILMFLAVLQLLFGNLLGAIWWFILGMFLKMIANASYQQVLFKSTLGDSPVSEFMRAEPDTVSPEITIDELVNEHIYRQYHSTFPVVAGSGRLVGSISTEEVRKIPREQWMQRTVAEAMVPRQPENTVPVSFDAMEAFRCMSKTGRKRLMVVEGEKLAGILALHDLVNYLSAKLQLEGDGTGKGLAQPG